MVGRTNTCDTIAIYTPSTKLSHRRALSLHYAHVQAKQPPGDIFRFPPEPIKLRGKGGGIPGKACVRMPGERSATRWIHNYVLSSRKLYTVVSSRKNETDNLLGKKTKHAYIAVGHAGLRPVVPYPIVRSARAATTLLFYRQRLR